MKNSQNILQFLYSTGALCCCPPYKPHQDINRQKLKKKKVIFPNVKDTGLDLIDIPIVIVHNGLHHFVGAHYPQPTFKHGILDICQHLQQARFIAD